MSDGSKEMLKDDQIELICNFFENERFVRIVSHKNCIALLGVFHYCFKAYLDENAHSSFEVPHLFFQENRIAALLKFKNINVSLMGLENVEFLHRDVKFFELPGDKFIQRIRARRADGFFADDDDDDDDINFKVSESQMTVLANFLHDARYVEHREAKCTTEMGCFLAVFQLYCEETNQEFFKPDANFFKNHSIISDPYLIGSLHMKKDKLPDNYTLDFNGNHQRLLINDVRAPDKFTALQKFLKSTDEEQKKYIADKMKKISINFVEKFADQLATCPMCFELFFKTSKFTIVQEWILTIGYGFFANSVEVCSENCQKFHSYVVQACKANLFMLTHADREHEIAEITMLSKASYFGLKENLQFHSTDEKIAYAESCRERDDYKSVEFVELPKIHPSKDPFVNLFMHHSIVTSIPSRIAYSANVILKNVKIIKSFKLVLQFLSDTNFMLRSELDAIELWNIIDNLITEFGWDWKCLKRILHFFHTFEGKTIKWRFVAKWISLQQNSLNFQNHFYSLHLAIENSHYSVWEPLFKKSNLRLLDNHKENILHVAAKRGVEHFVRVTKLLKQVDCCQMMVEKNENGSTPIQLLQL